MLEDVGLIAGGTLLGSGFTLHLFRAEDTALLHCQTGVLSVASQRMFDRLDESV